MRAKGMRHKIDDLGSMAFELCAADFGHSP